MMKVVLLLLLLFYCLVFPALSHAGDIKPIKQWKHEEVFCHDFGSLIDTDDCIINIYRFKGKKE